MFLTYGNKHTPLIFGSTAKTVKVLGASRRLVGRKSTVRAKRVLEAQRKASRIRTLASRRRPKALIAGASLQSRALYACELDPLTALELATLRVATATALNCHWGAHNRIAAMLLTANGLYEPKAQYTYRVLSNWRRQMPVKYHYLLAESHQGLN